MHDKKVLLTRGVGDVHFGAVEGFIDIEIRKILRLQGITYKTGITPQNIFTKQIEGKKTDKGSQFTTQNGSKNRSTRHINATPYHPIGFIIKTNIENILQTDKKDLCSGFGKHKQVTQQDKVTIQKAIQEFNNEEQFNFAGEIILNNLTPDMIQSIYIDLNLKRFTISGDGSSLKYSPFNRAVGALAMQQKYLQYTGVKLPIVDIETQAEVSIEILEKQINNGFLKDGRNMISENLTIATYIPEVFKNCSKKTQNFSTQYIKDGLTYLDKKEEREKEFSNFLKRMEELSTFHESGYIELAAKRKLLWAKEQKEEVENFYNQAYKRTDLNAIIESDINCQTRLEFIDKFIEDKSYNPRLLAIQLQENYLEEIRRCNKTFRESILKKIQEITEGKGKKKLSDVFPHSSRIKAIESKLDPDEIQEFAGKLLKECYAKNASQVNAGQTL